MSNNQQNLWQDTGRTYSQLSPPLSSWSNENEPIRGESFSFERCELLLKLIAKQAVVSADSYQWSPGYYKFTGRDGAIIHSDGSTFMCVEANHPNQSNVKLIFPPIGSDPEKATDFLLDLIVALRGQDRVVRVARLSKAVADLLLQKAEGRTDFALQQVSEEVLDWKYPIYILNTQNVAQRSGGKFQQVRQRLRKLDRNDFQVELLEPNGPFDELMAFIKHWAGDANRKHSTSLESLIHPSKALLEIFQRYPKRFSGQVIKINGTIVSYALWELPLMPGMPANEFATASSHQIQGLSEWQIVMMCEALYENGIQHVNIGGSEELGLDRFKRKFNPEFIEVLQSLDVIKK